MRLNLKILLDQRVRAAMTAAGVTDADAVITPAARPEFGDYQANGVMQAAKRMRRNPRELAADVVAKLDLSGIAENVDIAGPGLHQHPAQQRVAGRHREPRKTSARQPRRLPKRSSSITRRRTSRRKCTSGICAARSSAMRWRACFGRLGQRVIAQNHLGDWGTQFGMLLAYLEETGSNSELLGDLERFYQAAKQRFDADPAFAEKARARVVALQSGEPRTNALWRQFVDISLGHCEAVYERLGVSLTRADVMGESAYNDDLPRIVEALDAAGMLTDVGRRTVRFPRRIQGQGRFTAARHRSEIGRRIPLFDDRSGGRAVSLERARRRPRPVFRRCAAGVALSPDLRRRAPRRLRIAAHVARTPSVRRHARQRRPAVPFARWRRRQTRRPARRGATARLRTA